MLSRYIQHSNHVKYHYDIQEEFFPIQLLTQRYVPVLKLEYCQEELLGLRKEDKYNDVIFSVDPTELYLADLSSKSVAKHGGISKQFKANCTNFPYMLSS